MNKQLYKIEIWILKTLPFILSILMFLDFVFGCIGIACVPVAYLGSVSVIPWLFLFISSFVFKFCIWHRIPLYYIATSEIFNLVDYLFLPHISNHIILIIYSLMFGLFSIICGILKYFKNDKRTT